MTSEDLTPEMLEWLTRNSKAEGPAGPAGDPEDLEKLHEICWGGKDLCPCSRCAGFKKARTRRASHE